MPFIVHLLLGILWPAAAIVCNAIVRNDWRLRARARARGAVMGGHHRRHHHHHQDEEKEMGVVDDGTDNAGA